MKKFTADSYYEAYLQAQAELGEDVMIITSRTTSKSAWGGLYSKDYVEITAAVPTARTESTSRPAPARPALTQEVLAQQQPPTPQGRINRMSLGSDSPVESSRPAVSTREQPVYTHPKTVVTQSNKSTEMRGSYSIRSNQEGDSNPVPQRVFQNDGNSEQKIQVLLDTLSRHKGINSQAAVSNAPNAKRTVETPSQATSTELRIFDERLNTISQLLERMVKTSSKALESDICDLPEGIASLRKRLIEIETPEEVARDIVSQIMSECPKKAMHSSFSTFQFASNWLKNALSFTQEPVLNSEFGPRIFILIGPTGVGKTTTIAKLAASFALNVVQRRSVALFTLDTYRIGAPHQLQQYAQIIEADMEIIIEPNDIPDALKRHKKKDVILVDTAGRCQKNTPDLNELKSFLDKFPTAEKFLVLSATTKFSDMLETVKCFKMTDFDHLIFSKVDETNTCGPLLALLHKTNYSLAYITTGQSVPDDFKPASAEFFNSQIFDTVQ